MADWDPGTPLPDSFFEIAQRVYANDPDWLPEDKQSIAPLFTSGNPFFGIGEAWVSVKGNTRLVGFRDPRISYNEEPVAYFGYWETEDDQEVNRARAPPDARELKGVDCTMLLYNSCHVLHFNLPYLTINKILFVLRLCKKFLASNYFLLLSTK